VLTFGFWVWVILAILLGVAEMLSGGFFMLPFAVGAAVAAAIALAGLPLPWQLVGFAVTAGIALVLARVYMARHNAGPSQQLAGNRLIGKTGIVLTELNPVADTGIVRVDREQWRAEPSTNATVPEGARVTVTAVEGAHLVVAPVLEEPSELDA